MEPDELAQADHSIFIQTRSKRVNECARKKERKRKRAIASPSVFAPLWGPLCFPVWSLLWPQLWKRKTRDNTHKTRITTWTPPQKHKELKSGGQMKEKNKESEEMETRSQRPAGLEGPPLRCLWLQRWEQETRMNPAQPRNTVCASRWRDGGGAGSLVYCLFIVIFFAL